MGCLPKCVPPWTFIRFVKLCTHVVGLSLTLMPHTKGRRLGRWKLLGVGHPCCPTALPLGM